MVTRLAWIAHRLQSSIKCTMKSSVACTYINRSYIRILELNAINELHIASPFLHGLEKLQTTS